MPNCNYANHILSPKNLELGCSVQQRKCLNSGPEKWPPLFTYMPSSEIRLQKENIEADT